MLILKPAQTLTKIKNYLINKGPQMIRSSQARIMVFNESHKPIKNSLIALNKDWLSARLMTVFDWLILLSLDELNDWAFTINNEPGIKLNLGLNTRNLTDDFDLKILECLVRILVRLFALIRPLNAIFKQNLETFFSLITFHFFESFYLFWFKEVRIKMSCQKWREIQIFRAKFYFYFNAHAQ